MKDVVHWLENKLVKYFSELHSTEKSVLEIHQGNIWRHTLHWAHIQSNQICLTCLWYPPEYILICGHSICEECIKAFVLAVFSVAYRFHINDCVLCGIGKLMISLKPPTAGIWILSIDGGGI